MFGDTQEHSQKGNQSVKGRDHVENWYWRHTRRTRHGKGLLKKAPRKNGSRKGPLWVRSKSI